MQIEHVDGGELFDRIVNLGFYSEQDAKRFITKTLSRNFIAWT